MTAPQLPAADVFEPHGPERAVPEPAAPDPDDKDWTWVLDRSCPECGFDPTSVAVADLPGLVVEHTDVLRVALTRPGFDRRPQPATWSALEYACHVRDVCSISVQRVDLLLDEDDPLFPNWDQDATALQERYWTQDRTAVGAELASAAATLAQSFAGVEGHQWQRPGRRSNGSTFTVETLGRYVVHDLAHHAADVSS